MRCFTAASMFALGPLLLGAQSGAGEPRLSDLPLHEVPATVLTRRIAVLLTGDGGWASFARDLATRLAQQGIGVVGLDSRAYLGRARSPEIVAADLARILRHYRTAWNATQVTIIGYSRGADIGPFAVNRLPDDLRQAVDQVVLIGLGASANFMFHWQDLLRDVTRADDLPTRPEVEKLAGTPVLCFAGDDDASDTCRLYVLSPAFRVIRHDGAHRPADAAPFVREILASVPTPTRP
jgi:type IV secretory pathway VirJ component